MGTLPFALFNRTDINGPGDLTGANALDVASIGIAAGLLVDDAALVKAGYERIHEDVVIVNEVKEDGIRADGSFAQHNGIIYNGNYGKD